MRHWTRVSVASQRDYLGDICGRQSVKYKEADVDINQRTPLTGSHFVGVETGPRRFQWF
jgi:hypothetical protein